MTPKNEYPSPSDTHATFNLEVLNSEIQDIKKRRFTDKNNEVVSRGSVDCLDLEQFIESSEQRSTVFNQVVDELYSEENNAAWQQWQNALEPEKEANDPMRKGFVGLAFSGGGIRSATFNLGVLQALSSLGIFKCVDYLSTVSGGGYIGSCVSSLYASIEKEVQDQELPKDDDTSVKTSSVNNKVMQSKQKHHEQEAHECQNNTSKDDAPIDDDVTITASPFEHKPCEHESAIFRYLRNHANYLAPEGFIDALLIPALLLRGVIVNFLVLLPYLLLASIVTVWLMPTANHIAGTEVVDVFGVFQLSSRFILTKCLMIFFVAAMALFPLCFMFIRSGNPERKLSGWRLRHTVGKLMSGYIAATGVIAFIELQPIAIQFIHDLETESFDSIDMSIFSGALGATLAMFANHVLPKISKFSGLLAVYVMGALGFATIWLVYLALCSSAIDWDIATHELVIDNANRFINDYERLQLIILAAIIVVMGYQWLKGCVAVINTKTSVILTWFFVLAGLAAFGYHHFVHEIPIAKLSTADLKAEHLERLANYSLVGFILWLYSLACVDVNFTSIHRFYRDKLSKAYIIGIQDNAEETTSQPDKQVVHTEGVRLSSLNTQRAPYHLINALLNLQKTSESHKSGRHGDFFIFSKNYIGGAITGYCKTKRMESVSRHVDLATAMAISGAAAAPNAGKVTVKPLIFIMAMLNIRLSYWLLNPAKVNSKNLRFYNSPFSRVGPTYFLRELFGKPDAKHNFVNLSDGGHIENLGVYELLRRQCRLIICGDGEADKQLTFQGLSELVRMAQIDLGIKIDVDGLDMIRRGEQHHAICTIHYSEGRIGKLIYLKSSLLGDNSLKATLAAEQYRSSQHRDDNFMYDNNAYIAHYKENNPDFPHQTTADQFFDEAQFECYRALGYQVALTTLSQWRDKSDNKNRDTITES